MPISSKTPRFSKAESLVEAWQDRINVVESVDGAELPYEKRIVLAQCLETI